MDTNVKSFLSEVLDAVNKDLLKYYKQHMDMADADDLEFLFVLISSKLIYQDYSGEKFINEAKKISSDIWFNSVGEWVDYYMRTSLGRNFPMCANCFFFREDHVCEGELYGYKVNPNFEDCGHFLVRSPFSGVSGHGLKGPCIADPFLNRRVK